MADLASLLAVLRRPEKTRREIPQRIDLCSQALALIERDKDPLIWGWLQLQLGVSLRQNPRGHPAENLEQAIQHFQLALEENTRSAHPRNWAATHTNLAQAFGELLRSKRAENSELAIWHFNQALEVYTREAYPKDWAFVQQGLAYFFSHDTRGDRAENLEQAIRHYFQALKVRTRQAHPKEWAITQMGLAVVYGQRLRGDRAENLEQAISYCQQALTVLTMSNAPEDWASIHHNLGNAYLGRFRGRRAANIERAIDHYEKSLIVFTREDYPKKWAMVHNSLGNTYLRRILGKRAENLEQSIGHYRQALEVRTKEVYQVDWAASQHNLAVVFTKRLLGERSDNLEQAVRFFEKALEVRTRDAYPEDWAWTQNDLAVTYAERIRGEHVDNVRRAISHYHQALELRTLQVLPSGFQQTQHNLGDLYFVEGAWEQALAAYQAAFSAEKVLLASAYTEMGRLAEVGQTVGLYARAAYALLKLGRVGQALVQLEQGKARLLSRALALDEVDLNELPAAQCDTLHGLRQRIRELEDEMRLPLDTQGRSGDRTLAAVLKQARARLNDVIEDVRRTHPDFMSEGLELTEILGLIPEKGALIAPLVTSQGSAIFVVPSGRQSISLEDVVWVDEFKDTDLKILLRGSVEVGDLGGWLGAYFNARHNMHAWRDAIDETGRVLWERLIASVHERISSLGMEHILIMSQGGMGLMPLHAAWRERGGRRSYLLDEYIVSYMPSAYAWQISQARLSDTQRQLRTLLAVVNPTEDLSFTEPEGGQVSRLFGEAHAMVLPREKATVKAVKEARAGYAHFACHGFYRWDDPMQSGLLLANREPLTLAQIIGHLDLASTRLVTLSACDTGITDVRQAPDEYLGLPTGFLRAGAPAVVSTLWAVNDLSTMLLMERFYQLHLDEGLAIPEALRQAQIWLRDITAGELVKRFAAEEELALSGSACIPLETASAGFTRFASQDSAQRPFDHPFYWAAFTFSGA